MTGKTVQIVAIAAAVVITGAVTVVVTATGVSRGQNGGFVDHLHMLVGQHLHGGRGPHDQMTRMAEALDLTSAQVQRLERVNEMVETYGGHDSMVELHEVLVGQFERGEFGAAAIRRAIDSHIDEMRVTAHGVADEVVALVGELDDTQRETLLLHLRQTDAEGGGRGH